MDPDVESIVVDADVALNSDRSISPQPKPGSRGRNRNRKPYHFKNRFQNPDSAPSSVAIDPDDEAEEATYFRFRYYQRLRGNPPPPHSDETLLIPDHVVPQIFFYPYIPGATPSSGKQSSLITIFAIWNTMMGTSLLSMPWAVERAGLVAGLLLIAVMATVCLYTAYRNLQVFTLYESEGLDDFPDLCQLLLGRAGQVVAVVFSALCLLGASIVYWVLMSNFLFHTVQLFHDKISGGSSHEPTDNSTFNVVCPNGALNGSSLGGFFDEDGGGGDHRTEFDQFWDLHRTVPVYLAVVLLPLMCMKSATFFTKFNALGTVSVFYVVAFVLVKAGQWGWNVEFVDVDSPLYVPLVQPTLPALSGLLSLALFLHNCVVAIMKNNRRPEKNVRDLSIAYCLVAATYMGIGAVFFTSFPLRKNCIEDNFLNNFTQSDVMTVAARVFLFFQMMTVFPLLAYILRSQVLYALFNSSYPSWGHVVALNVFLTAVCVLFAIFLPQIGTITRFSGALCGLVYIFTLPCVLHVVSLRRQNGGRWPVGAGLVHGLLVVCGVVNLGAQFLLVD